MSNINNAREIKDLGDGNWSGNADTASKLLTSRTISLSGDVTGSAGFDGSSNISISCSVNDAPISQAMSTKNSRWTGSSASVNISNTSTFPKDRFYVFTAQHPQCCSGSKTRTLLGYLPSYNPHGMYLVDSTLRIWIDSAYTATCYTPTGGNEEGYVITGVYLLGDLS
jgi:hypothetical protein